MPLVSPFSTFFFHNCVCVQELGQGSFGQVFRATYRGTVVAVRSSCPLSLSRSALMALFDVHRDSISSTHLKIRFASFVPCLITSQLFVSSHLGKCELSSPRCRRSRVCSWKSTPCPLYPSPCTPDTKLGQEIASEPQTPNP